MAQRPGERRRVRLAQPRVHRRRIGRPGEARAPRPRQVHLEDVAGTQVIVDARHAVEESRRIVFLQHGRDERACRRRGVPVRDGVDDRREQRVGTGLGDREAAAVAPVAHDRRRAAQRERHRQRAVGRGQSQRRFDLRRQFVREEQAPAAPERDRDRSTGGFAAAGFCRRGAAPGRGEIPVERREETARDRGAVEPAHRAVGTQLQAGAVAAQQQVPARLRTPGDALEQQRESRRVGRLQLQQVDARRQRVDRHRDAGGRVQTRRKTRVPLVPPKPNPFDIATSIFASRAALGT